MSERIACCRVVLVRPSIAANIGAAARVMRNFGLRDLHLVAPEADPLAEESRRLSTHGEGILHAARRHATLAEAIADCVCAVATSSRTGGPFRRQSVGTPAEIIPRLVQAASLGPAALVFGPEKDGLSDREVSQCHYLMTIQTEPSYPALNLAQAVAISLFALSQALAGPPPLLLPDYEPASKEHLERAFANLEKGLTDIHFLWGEKGGALMHALKHLIQRALPSRMEADLLLGLARQLRWLVDHGGVTRAGPCPPPESPGPPDPP